MAERRTLERQVADPDKRGKALLYRALQNREAHPSAEKSVNP
jgi:hypothetical protein